MKSCTEGRHLRLYPDEIPEFYGEPSFARISYRYRGEVGWGLITLVPVLKGARIFNISGDWVQDQTLFSLQRRKGVYLHDPWVMGRMLHSCSPNTKALMNEDPPAIVSTRNIKAGEFLTLDYEDTEDFLYREFHCSCGAAGCRGFIAGRLAHGD